MRPPLNTIYLMAAKIAQFREAFSNEARAALVVPGKMLRLALNEAEALAWQTVCPHLVFPELASEKVRDLAVWSRRQQLLLSAPPRGGHRVITSARTARPGTNGLRALSF